MNNMTFLYNLQLSGGINTFFFFFLLTMRITFSLSLTCIFVVGYVASGLYLVYYYLVYLLLYY